ncbi:MAG: MFS transporter, partial [Proteobacteria bacterium]|nr:MFS transporter [Pseudomonadota bacterium]
MSTKRILGYLAGFAPLVLMYGIFNIAYIDFFSDNLKLDDTLLIIGLVIYGIVNSFNDPIIGHTQDNTNVKRWGSRRVVYIKYVCPFLILVFIAMWFPWHETNQTLMFLHFVVSICLFDTLLNIVTMAWMALLPDMTPDVDKRTRINFLGGIIALFVGLSVMIVPTIINDRGLFQKFNMGVGIVALVCYLVVVKLSKESPEFQEDISPPLWESIKQTLKLKSFLMYVGWVFTKSFNGSIGMSYLFVFLLILGKENLV